MKSKVYWGSPRQAHLEAGETLPAKLDLILNALHLRDRVKPVQAERPAAHADQLFKPRGQAVNQPSECLRLAHASCPITGASTVLTR